jgi:cytochrome c-type biogenesis protein CcsB
MLNLVEKFFASFKTAIVLLLVYAFIMAFATVLEKYHGSEAAKAMIYYSPFFILLQILLVVNFIVASIKHHYLKRGRWGLITVHFAFIVILTGALVSFLTGENGMMHIRNQEISNKMVIDDKGGMDVYKSLPFSIELVKFKLSRYPGSTSPSSYESFVRVHETGKVWNAHIYMNNVLDVHGYRFFQASYDEDENGTILSVNHDVMGRNITYTGYLILVIGLILCFVGKESRFSFLRHQLKEIRKVTTIMLFFMLFIPVLSSSKEKSSPMLEAIEKFSVDKAHAAHFGALSMQSSNGRMIPVNTFSSEILRKLHKDDKIGNLNSDQFLISLMALPEMWMRVPLISFSNYEMASYYDLPNGACSFIDVFDAEGNYKLQEKLEKAYNKMPSQRSRFDKDLMKLDEQINIFNELLGYKLLRLFPKENDPAHTWYAAGDSLTSFHGRDSMFVANALTAYLSEVQKALKGGDWSNADKVVDMISTYQQKKGGDSVLSPTKIQAELKYNKLNLFRYCKIGYLILGGILLILSFVSLIKQRRWINGISWALCLAIAIVFCFHMYGIGIRWYIAGYAPWSNSYETMVYVAWATVLAGLLFMRRNRIVLALAALFGGIILFVSGLNWMDPEINPLVPVLKSPWLMFHVAVIVAAYGFFGISCLMGLTNLVILGLMKEKNRLLLSQRIRELSIVNEMSLWVGLALMTIGTFLGAVWANESWGRYWGWDPKETWALITMVVYAVVTHLHLIKRFNNLWTFNVTSVLAFSSVLMTFFGVNYFLSGMHSYGQNEHVDGIFVYLYGALIVVGILAIWTRSKRNLLN